MRICSEHPVSDPRTLARAHWAARLASNLGRTRAKSALKLSPSILLSVCTAGGIARPLTEDLQLLSAWRDGDKVAGDQFVGLYFPALYRFFASKLGDDVADLVQDTFLSCLESKGATPRSLRSYLFGIAHHKLTDRLRSHYQVQDITLISMAELATSHSQRLVRGQRDQALLTALQILPLDQQITVELTYWEGLSGAEIAEITNVSPATVRTRLARARSALRDQLQQNCDLAEVMQDFSK